jgi:hypothetical protein
MGTDDDDAVTCVEKNAGAEPVSDARARVLTDVTVVYVNAEDSTLNEPLGF